MKTLKKIHFSGHRAAILLTVIALMIGGIASGKAQPLKKADSTITDSGIRFTQIPSTADRVKGSVQKQDRANNTSSASLKAVNLQNSAPKNLWEIFIKGFLGGFAAFLLPCVYPLLPLTVGYFSKKAGSRAKSILQSLFYGLSIILIYVVFGLLITLIFGPAALNGLATNGIFNLFFFLLLLVFGISFLGAFEILLPSSFANKLDQKSDQGGLAGIFFMASTLVVISFSCTGPAIGLVLVDAVTKGERLAPIVVMFGFSLAIAIPFTLFAMFPSALKRMPKSGGWLNSVKVFLGFIEIAFSLKYLSNVDLAYHWDWFDREIMLSLWIAITLMLGLYLIGKIRFSHDSEVTHLSVPRTFFAIAVFAFLIYMIPGLWGAPLKSISAMLPPLSTQDFNLSAGIAPVPGDRPAEEIRKYEAIFKRLPKVNGIADWYDYEQAIAIAQKEHKPLLIDFTGWNCVNCRQMEQNVFPDAEVLKRLKNEFVIVQMVIDDKTELPSGEQTISRYNNKRLQTIGAKNLDMEIATYGSNAQPYYVIADNSGKILVTPQGATPDIPAFIKYLDSGIDAFKRIQ